MNLLNFKTAKICINLFIFIALFFVDVRVKALDIDFSRRQKDMKSSSTYRGPASALVDVNEPTYDPKLVAEVFDSSSSPQQEVVILNTEKGFIPSTVRLKKGGNYKIHIVNVNDKEKNVSFILDAFSEHHATYFGEEKSFTVMPKQDGIYSYVCPETSKQGRVVVYSDKESDRRPASLNK